MQQTSGNAGVCFSSGGDVHVVVVGDAKHNNVLLDIIDPFLYYKKVWWQPEGFTIYHPTSQSVNKLAGKPCILNVVEKSMSAVAQIHVMLVSHVVIQSC